MEDSVVSVWSGTSGKLDDVPLADIKRFDKEFLDFLRREHADILSTIHDSGKLEDATVDSLTGAIDEFKNQFRTGDGHILGHEKEEEAIAEGDIDRVAITKKVRKG